MLARLSKSICFGITGSLTTGIAATQFLCTVDTPASLKEKAQQRAEHLRNISQHLSTMVSWNEKAVFRRVEIIFLDFKERSENSICFYRPKDLILRRLDRSMSLLPKILMEMTSAFPSTKVTFASLSMLPPSEERLT